MPGQRADLCFELHYGSDLAEGDVLPTLQNVLPALAPKMAATCAVRAYDRDPGSRPVDPSDPDSLRAAVVAKGTERGPTFQALAKSHGAPAQGRRFGHAMLRGRGAGTRGFYLSVDFDSRVPATPSGGRWLWSNSIGGRISTARVEGSPRQEWVVQLIEHLAVTTTMLWGAAYLQPEFRASNLDTTAGVRAIGRDIRTSLPGIYWLNVFGPPYVQLIGEERLHGAPAAGVERKGEHVLVRAYQDAENWAAHDQSRRSLMAALGAEYFFDRNAPTRRQQAPDFGLPELPERQPFRVLTTDGSPSPLCPDVESQA